MEEKEAKEDQGNDRHHVGRIGAETCFGLHEVLQNRRRKLFGLSWVCPDGRGELFGLSWGVFGWVRGVFWAFAEYVWMGVWIDVWFHGVLVIVRRDWCGRAQKKPDTGSRRRSAGIRLGGWGIEVSYGFR